jgi:Flp pilus assembly protein TadD
MASTRPVDREAYEAYLKGRYFWNRRNLDGLKKAIVFFQRAVDQNPRYALAYAGLAESYFALSFYNDAPSGQYFPKATAAATKALEIDDTLAEAHVALGNTLTFYDWDWPGAEREFRRGLALNPSDALGHRSYAAYLSGMGRHREALAEATRSQELDPLSLDINTIAGRCYYHARQYDQAIAQYRRALEIDPSFDIAQQFLGKAYAQKGLYREAVDELRKIGSPYSEPPSVLGFVYAVSGRPSEARRVLEQLQEMRKHQYVPPWSLVRVYTGLGDNDQAFEWLEQSVQERDERLVWLEVDPMLDNLRSDARFDQFLRRLKFPR